MEDDWDSIETTKHSLAHQLNFKDHSNDDLHPNYVVVKQNTKFCGWQTFLYLTIAYFLSLAIFYLLVTFSKHEPIQCQLTCSPDLMQCQCQLSQALWKGPTSVQLSWDHPSLKQDIILGDLISGVLLEQNNTSYLISVDPEPEESCFPTACQIFVGFIDQQLAQDSLLTITFQIDFPFNSDAVIKGFFYESSQSHPQLFTKSQLAINLIFAILVGVYSMLRKSISLDLGIKASQDLNKKQLKHIQQYEEIPSQVEEINRQLKYKYQLALKIYLKASQRKNETESEYSQSDEMSLEQ